MAVYLRASSLDDALAARAAQPLVVLAGATDIYPAHAARVGWGQMTRPDVLDISGLGELRGITMEDDGSVRIGALSTWSEIASADMPPVFDGLRTAARAVGGVQVQNRGTLAGNLCTASPAGDGIPCLISLDGSVEIASVRGRRRLPVEDFVTGYRSTALVGDEIVTAIVIPPPMPDEVGAFLKLGARAYLVISIAMVAGTLAVAPDGRIVRARIAVGACAPVARRLRTLEARLVGSTPAHAAGEIATEDFGVLDPIDDVRASGAYRRHSAEVLVRDLLAALAAAPARRAA